MFSLFISPTFATEINAPATCDSGTLSTDTGPTNLRANFEANKLNLKWYDENDNRLTVPTSSNSCTYGGTITMPTPPEKRGYTFKGWKVLPYNQIEYIEATGTQYINTGITPTVNFAFYLDGMITNSTEWLAIFGTSTGSIQSRIFSSTVLNSAINGDSGMGGISFGGVNNRFYIGLSPHKILEASGYERIVERPYSPSGTFMLLNYGGASMKGRARIYGAKFYDGNNLVFDLIPVKDSNGVACMYDKVSKQFFYNAGTGNFIAGPDL